jgi:hypothetical protein
MRLYPVEIPFKISFTLPDISNRYGTSSISKETLQELNAKIVAKLRKWKSTLPPVLQINLDDVTSPYLPHVLILQYVIVFIVIYPVSPN